MNPEGKLTVKEHLESAELEQIETYALKPPVPGLAEIAKGLRVPYATTIYNRSGDDTSGIAGILFASGEFRSVIPPRKTQRYWFDEELRVTQFNSIGRPSFHGFIIGDVVWDGSIAGSINHAGVDGDNNGPVFVREFDASLGCEWETTGELWRAFMSGNAMHGGRTVGKIHHLPEEDHNYV